MAAAWASTQRFNTRLLPPPDTCRSHGVRGGCSIQRLLLSPQIPKSLSLSSLPSSSSFSIGGGWLSLFSLGRLQFNHFFSDFVLLLSGFWQSKIDFGFVSDCRRNWEEGAFVFCSDSGCSPSRGFRHQNSGPPLRSGQWSLLLPPSLPNSLLFSYLQSNRIEIYVSSNKSSDV